MASANFHVRFHSARLGQIVRNVGAHSTFRQVRTFDISRFPLTENRRHRRLSTPLVLLKISFVSYLRLPLLNPAGIGGRVSRPEPAELPAFLLMSFGENFERLFLRRTIKWHFPFANVNLFAVDRANITTYTHIPWPDDGVGDGEREEGRWRMREGGRNDEWICGLYPWEYYGFKVSRGLTK